VQLRDSLLREIREGGLEPGDRFPSETAIRDRYGVSRATVRQAVESALQRAVDWGIEHLALAPFGIGAGNLDIEESAEVMAEVVRRHREVAKYPTTITIVVETAFEHDVFERLVCGGVH
jgi:O-acetyl-ADP-ribose deacetylase (regulator of RNase III)